MLIVYINNFIYHLHHNEIIYQQKQQMDRNNWKEIIDLTTPRQTHPVAFSYFKDKGENVGQEYATIEGKWLWMSRLEKEPYLKKFLQSEQSSLLKNIDLQSQIREVKYRYHQPHMAIKQMEKKFSPTALSYRFNFTLLDNIIAATEDKFFLYDLLDHFYSEKNTTSLAHQFLSDQINLTKLQWTSQL